MGYFPFCVPKKRIKFVSPIGKKNSPTHSNIIVYIPGTVDRTEVFKEEMSSLGCVIVNSNI